MPQRLHWLLAYLVVGAVTISAYRVLCKLENKRRDKLQGGDPVAQAQEEMRDKAFSDKTNREKLNFRCTY